MAKLPVRPQWYRDMIAGLRAERNAGDTSRTDFAEHAADEIVRRHKDGDPFLRSLAIADVRAYDSAVDREQGIKAGDLEDIEGAGIYIVPSLFTDDELAALGLDRVIDLGWGKTIRADDLDYEANEKAIAEFDRKAASWEKSMQEKKAPHERLRPVLASDKAKKLPQLIDNRPDEEYGTR